MKQAREFANNRPLLYVERLFVNLIRSLLSCISHFLKHWRFGATTSEETAVFFDKI